ncbi:UNVERIFIED_ORG: hypothetical protein M2312_003637 [Rhizobium esperanzae]|uniref:Uncharacterized protein n=1 Tax=Rhizobium phaseoli TaxID=396 RepID=A0A192TEG5_9HYPH|nr:MULTISPECIES: hypothetical protein [Rhizobium]MDH6648981.1 hypothetical protein [Rhizobium esperanzae]ANL42458.1 hypothetical protein AMC88_CH04125 [Rhizobium phaseoli]ANL55136.1 hypothetical protein AMC86_CH04056 [Rhizobium phaseoli]ANL61444.1 hypothetical protein AMC85_CH04122 [Rhizobium phaseoli]ANL86749.1 hypothetical protein AMC81_CH04036 [Rhizobium phaseoli]
MFSGAQVSPFSMSGRFAGAMLDVFNGFAHLWRRAIFQARKGGCGILNCCMNLSPDRFRFEESCSRKKA